MVCHHSITAVSDRSKIWKDQKWRFCNSWIVYCPTFYLSSKVVPMLKKLEQQWWQWIIKWSSSYLERKVVFKGCTAQCKNVQWLVCNACNCLPLLWLASSPQQHNCKSSKPAVCDGMLGEYSKNVLILMILKTLTIRFSVGGSSPVPWGFDLTAPFS